MFKKKLVFGITTASLLMFLLFFPLTLSSTYAASDKCIDGAGNSIDGDGREYYGAPGGFTPSIDEFVSCTSIDTGAMGFRIPSLGDILTFAIRAFFVIAGLAALFYLLLGAFGWITSGGDKDSIGAARDKIQAAVLGMILIVAVLAIIWTLEQVIFNRRICLGLSCPLTLPGLLTRTVDGDYCCVCLEKSTGQRKALINTSGYRCLDTGLAVIR